MESTPFDLVATQKANTELAPIYSLPSDRNPALVYLASLAAGSRRTMRQALDTVADILTSGLCDCVTLPWGSLRFQHTQAARAALMERYSAATANKMLSALRQTLRTAWSLGYMNAEEYQRATDLKPIKGEKPEASVGRSLAFGEWVALLSVCSLDSSPAGARDAAIIALLKVAGLRRSEVASLQLEDYDQEAKMLFVRGKRNKVRNIPIEDVGALDAISDWLYVRGLQAGHLFTQVKKGGQVTEDALSDRGIYHILLKRGGEAQVKSFAPHDLRRTFAGDLLDAGADLATVQKLMGHSSANTTASYDRRGERVKREAVKKLHAPYTRRYGS